MRDLSCLQFVSFHKQLCNGYSCTYKGIHVGFLFWKIEEMELLVQKVRIFLCLLIHIPRLFSKKVIPSLYSYWWHTGIDISLHQVSLFLPLPIWHVKTSLSKMFYVYFYHKISCAYWHNLLFYNGMFLCPKSTEAESMGMSPRPLLF